MNQLYPYTPEQIELGKKIIADVIERYRDPSNRCSIGVYNTCLYGTPDGRSCALGYYLLPEIREVIVDSCFTKGDGKRQLRDLSVFAGASAEELVSTWLLSFRNTTPSVEVEKLDDMLVPEVRGMPETFWSSIQKFHDNPTVWKKSSPSEPQENVEAIRRKYLSLNFREFQ